MALPPGYPYENTYASSPYGSSSDNAFVISAAPQGRVEGAKKWIFLTLFLLVVLSFVMSLIVVQKKQSVADTRNFAYEDTDSSPVTGFGRIGTTPANIAANNLPCQPDDTRPNCQVARTTIESVRVSFTPTPTPTRRPVVSQAIAPPVTSLLGSIETQTPTPTTANQSAHPSATPVPVQSCQRVELYKGSENISQNVSVIAYGDTIRFIGYASNTGVPIASITFRLTVNDQVVEEKQAPATLSGDVWVAQYEHTFTQYATHRVTVIAVTPK